MTEIKNSNRVPEGYTLFLNVTDTMGRKWKLKAAPNGPGSSAYFNSLTELQAWKAQVEDTRAMLDGKPTFRSRVMDHVYLGNMSLEVAEKMIRVHYGEVSH